MRPSAEHRVERLTPSRTPYAFAHFVMCTQKSAADEPRCTRTQHIHAYIYIYIHTHTSVCHNCMHVMREATPQRSSQGAAAHGGHLGWKDGRGQGSTAAPRASGQGTRGTRRPEHTYTQTHTNACTRTCTFAHANSVRYKGPPLEPLPHTPFLARRTAAHTRASTHERATMRHAMPSGRRRDQRCIAHICRARTVFILSM